MPKKVHAAHILLKGNQEINVAYYDVTHGMDFSDVARARSLCPSAKKGGDLGWFGKGKMVKEFEDAAFSIPAGQISRPFKSQFGWHIVKVIETQ
ncbi:MAG: peptidylprolyl isomerase [Nanoarchaeota archaeon]|nr:MAG: peptidylprolyl isomerase [Nanoarchaeota archaeon]